MIVISRRKDENIVIGDEIVVGVVDVLGDRVRLGVEAPSETSVHRQEVYEAIHRPTPQPETPQPTTITLSERHVAMLDRLRASIEAQGGRAPSREQALGAILDAFEAAQASVAEATLPAHLEANLDEDRRVEE